MKMGTMLGDVIQSLFKPPATQRYPFERGNAPERLRGLLRYDPARCVGCQLCVRDCPSNALELIVVDKPAKRFVLRYHMDRCTFCAQCVVSCRFGCLKMTSEDWELASPDKDQFIRYYGNQSDIEAILARPFSRLVDGGAEN